MFDRFKQKFDRTPVGAAERVPPGQYVTEKFPVLHYGSVPEYNDLRASWDFRVWGEIEAPKRFTFDPGNRPLSCRIQKRDRGRGALKIILIAGNTTRSVQQINSPGGTINLSYGG